MPQQHCCYVICIQFIVHLHNTYTKTNIYDPLHHTKCRYTKLHITTAHTHTRAATRLNVMTYFTQRYTLSMLIQESLEIKNTKHLIKCRSDTFFRKRKYEYINTCWRIQGTKPAKTMNTTNLNRPIAKVMRSKALTALTTPNARVVGLKPGTCVRNFFVFLSRHRHYNEPITRSRCSSNGLIDSSKQLWTREARQSNPRILKRDFKRSQSSPLKSQLNLLLVSWNCHFMRVQRCTDDLWDNTLRYQSTLREQ